MTKKDPAKELLKMIRSGKYAACLIDDCENFSSHISGLCLDHRSFVCIKCNRKFTLEGYAPARLQTKLCWRCIRWKTNQRLVNNGIE
jgi:transposase-like protein